MRCGGSSSALDLSHRSDSGGFKNEGGLWVANKLFKKEARALSSPNHF